jgi:hypothetical protein
MDRLPLPPAPNHIQINNVTPGQSAASDGGGLPRVSGQCSAVIQGDPDGVFFVEGLETLALVHDPDAPPGSPRVWETVTTVDGAGPIDLGAGEALDITVRFACPAMPAKDSYSALAVATLDGQPQGVMRIPITATVLPEHLTVSVSQGPGTFNPGQTQTFSFLIDSSFRTAITGFFVCDGPKPPFNSLDPDPQFPTTPALGSVNVTLPVVCAGDAAPGSYTLSFSYRQIGGPATWGSVSNEVEVVIPQPPHPDPRKDHFDAVWVEGSTHRICQLTGGGDPEGLPHPNDTTRFALLGTDLGSSFDHFENGEHRTYFFFGDTNTKAGDQDGDAIAYTTDDQAEPEGLHLQFIMGDNQWRRLVIPGISLGTWEVPTGGFSHAGRIYVFATTGILKTADPPFMENSVLASTTDAHNNFDLAYFASHRDDNVDTSATGGKFINVAPFVINNDDWPGLPDTAQRGGQGLLMAGTGSYRRSAPYLSYAPLPDGQTPALGDWRYLQGFEFWEPGFGPNGPPSWSTAENDAMPLFSEQIGEISYCYNAGLKRWLIVYGGCSSAGCGIVLRSAPMPWGPWSEPQLIFNSIREGAQGKYMFECGPYGAYVISRYDRWDPASLQATFYYTLSNGSCNGDNHEPRYQVHLMKSSLRLINIG